MLRVKLKKNKAGAYQGFTCSGHTGFSERGTDIVCAGVSALTQTAVLALERLLELAVEVQVDYPKGFLDCTWADEPRLTEKISLVVETMRLGIEEIQNQYAQYVEISEVEV